MSGLKLPKLPDRTPVRHTIVVAPDLEQRLRRYAELYQTSYGDSEPIETLIPFMLDAFLQSDRGFLRESKSKLPKTSERRRISNPEEVTSIPENKRTVTT